MIGAFQAGVMSEDWTPASVATALWLDASDASTITASSGSVSEWRSKSGDGRKFTNASTGKPTTGAATLNGLNVVSFSSSYLTADDKNTWKFLHDGTRYIIGAVLKFGTSSDPNSVYTLMASTIGTTYIGMFLWWDDRSANSHNNATRIYISNGISDSRTIDCTVENFLLPNSYRCLISIADPGNATASERAKFKLIGAEPVSGNTATTNPSTSNPTHTLQIGAFNSGNLMTGGIAELVIIKNLIDSTTILNLETYFSKKWGPSL